MNSQTTGQWTTNYKGTTYVLDHHGRLQPAQRKADMATARLSRIDDNQQRESVIHRIVRDELDALTERLIRDVQREDPE